MIEKTTVYGHGGYLIHTEKPRKEKDGRKESLYGLFIYHDVGTVAGYGTWNKITIVSAIYNQKKEEWQFKMGRLKYGTPQRQESIGVRPEFWAEFQEAVNMIVPELLGKPIPTKKELEKLGAEVIEQKEERRLETEEEKLLNELSPKVKK